MYKVTIENLILKKGWHKFLPDFYNPSTSFFVVLGLGKDQTKIKRLSKTTNYVIKLGGNNTRFVKGKSFEVDLKNKTELCFQLILVEDKYHSSASLKSLEHNLNINSQIDEKKDLDQTKIIGFNLPINLLVPKDIIIFKNQLLELTFYLTLKNERL